MSIIGNILWFFLGGFLLFLWYTVAGLLLCITIIGIPFGIQLFKMAGVALHPFGRDVDMLQDDGGLNMIFNIIWLVCGWWEIAIFHMVMCILMSVTIVGIPFAKAHWRLMKMGMLPFGTHRA